MRQYKIDYNNSLTYDTNINEVNINGVNINGVNINGVNINGVNINGVNINEVNINGVNIKLIFTPINKNNKQNGLNFLTLKQHNDLKGILFNCFRAELGLVEDLPFYGKNIFSTNFSNHNYGNLCVFDSNNKIVGFMLYNSNSINDLFLIENVCFSETIRGKGYFKVVFNWFLKKISETNIKNKIGLYIWKDSPFNKDRKIEKLYEKYLFKYKETKVKDMPNNNKVYYLMIRDN
jgi:hypothetical protein